MSAHTDAFWPWLAVNWWWVLLILLFVGGPVLEFVGDFVSEVTGTVSHALRTRHKRRLQLEKARVRAQLAQLPAAQVQPSTTCGCGHDLAFHDPVSGRCHAHVLGEQKIRGCLCRQYTGPELLGRVMPPPVLDPSDESGIMRWHDEDTRGEGR